MEKPKLIAGAKGDIGELLCNDLQNEFEVCKIDVAASSEDRYFETDISDLDSLKMPASQPAIMAAAKFLAKPLPGNITRTSISIRFV